MPKRTLLLDADIPVYRAAVVAEKAIEWEPGIFTLHADMDEAKARLRTIIDDYKETYEADEVILCVTDDVNFRKDVYPQYKASRSDSRKPLLVKPMRDYLADEQTDFKSFRRPGLEGDDVIGILATHPTLVPGEKVILSGDKDLKQIPGLHAVDGDIEEQTAESGLYFHMFQTLTGDSTDGYPGLPGCGPKKAEMILNVRETYSEDDPLPMLRRWWRAITEAYAKAGLTVEDALVQARCAYILQAPHYDFKTKQPILWTP